MKSPFTSPHAAAVVYGRRVALDAVPGPTIREWMDAVGALRAADAPLVLAPSGLWAGEEPVYGEAVAGVAIAIALGPSGDDEEPLPVAVPAPPARFDLAPLDALALPWASGDDGRATEGWFLCPVGWSAALLERDGEELVTTSAEDTCVAVELDESALAAGDLRLVAERC